MAKEQLASQQFAYNLGGTGTVERSGNKIKMLTKKKISSFNCDYNGSRTDNYLVLQKHLSKKLEETASATITIVRWIDNFSCECKFRNDGNKPYTGYIYMYFAANPNGTIPRAVIDVLAPQEFKITVPANTTSYSSGTLRNRYGAYDATHIDAGGFTGFLSTMSKNPFVRDNNGG